MDAELVLQDARASEMQRYYARFAPRAGRLAYLLTGDSELAQDIAQEAFARSFGRITRLRDPDAFGHYVMTSVVNLTRKHWRKTAHQKRYLINQGALEARRKEEIPDVETRDELIRALRTLPYDQRAAIILRFYEDLSEREAAAVLRCRPGTVKSRVSRGLETLRIEMRGADDEGT